MLQDLKNSNTYIKYRHWEYWPMWLAYLPVLPVILYYALRMRRFFFFSNVNPGFKTGALMGASKFNILSQVPDRFKPVTILNTVGPDRLGRALDDIRDRDIKFPLIVKPDVGERALLVELIHNRDELAKYLFANDIDIIIQEYINLPKECGIFYIRKPHEPRGKVVSVGLKSFFTLYGDGSSTVRELMKKIPRYKLQIVRLEKDRRELLDKVLEDGEELYLEPIGNHNRGTTFIDGNHLITEELDNLFDRINAQMKEVHYGRFDIKYNSWEELCNGENFKILEMNGVASEPIHIYDSSVSLKDKYKSFYRLWKSIYEISAIQSARGHHPMNLFAAFRSFLEYKTYMRSLDIDWRNNPGSGFRLS